LPDLSFLQWLVILFGYMLGFFTSTRIVLQRREPTATLAWILAALLIPYFGVLIYVMIGRRRLNRQLRRRRARATEIEPLLSNVVVDNMDLLDTQTRPTMARPHDNVLARLSSRIGCRWPTVGNKVELLPDANVAYASMEQAIRAAKKHVHFQFYIFQQDQTGRRFRDLLSAKAKEGVDVRVLTDGVGSFQIDDFIAPLIRAGGKHAEFLPVGRLRRHWHLNLRNHRKIVVVDGEVAFTGGCNIGDEYTGRKKKVGRWRDTHLRIDGPAVTHLQEVFADDWFFAREEEPDDENWFPEVTPVGDAMVHIVASGPDTDTQPIQRIFFAAVNQAQERVFLTTPYFIPDQAMLVSLETAALRGVDVRLLLPHRSDAPLVLHAGRSYYKELLESGVRVFEYHSGILHAKTMVVDRSWATVGSANMDVRSFRLNFEVNAAIYGSDFADQLTAMFEVDLKQAREVRLDDIRTKRWNKRVAESLARTLSPVL
jgi:cardiolipin synthase